VEAVKTFQKSKGLTADGIAGPNTQHALYGTVPVGSGNIEYVNTPPYPVEKIDWYTGGIQTLFPRGKTVKVIDVKTHIAFWVKRWAGGYHADVEPLTANDTKAMCKIYNVSDAQQIATKDLWERRPLWVIVGSKVYAASMYGEPHNYPEGDTIANNDFKGQFCIHFTNSKTHAGNRVDPLHTAAIQAAYDAAH
jgi:peptidoglycan hydrolase-like protein with peptidoglycan-binding domain